MSIDTRNKRASACFPLMPWRTSLPSPDGTVDQGDKQQVVFLYSGILAGALVVACGLVRAYFDSKQPSFSFDSKQPSLEFTATSECG